MMHLFVGTTMRRHLFNFAGVLALLLWLAVLAMGVRSYWRLDLCGYEQAIVTGERHGGCVISSAAGTLQIVLWNRTYIGQPPGPGGSFAEFNTALDAETAAQRRTLANEIHGFRFLGFVIASEIEPVYHKGLLMHFSPLGWQTFHFVIIPYWMLAVLLTPLTALWLWRVAVRHRRPAYRRKHGLCLHCGYDLRASKDRCPECGTEIVPQQPARHPTSAVD
jgi:hypothetical protein